MSSGGGKGALRRTRLNSVIACCASFEIVDGTKKSLSWASMQEADIEKKVKVTVANPPVGRGHILDDRFMLATPGGLRTLVL